jgi:hypothetical protein
MGKRISQLAEITTVDSDDLLNIVDVSDTTYSASGTNKKVKRSNLIKDLTVDNLASGVLDTDLSSVSGNDDTIPSAKATKAFIDSLTNGWIPAEETWTYASSTTFTISGDKTGKYQKGDKIKLTQTSVKYFYIIGVSYSSNNTTITVTGGSDYSLANATITNPCFSKIENPQGFPISGFSYTPTISTTSNAGTFTETKFRLVGSYCFIKGRITYANALSSGNLTLSLPIAMSDLVGLFPIGFAHYFNTGIADRRCFVHTPNTTTIDFYYTDGNSSFTGDFVNSSSWSSGDWVEWTGQYTWM